MPEGLLLSSLVLLLIATTVAIFVSQVPCGGNGVPMQRSYAAADADGPRVIGGFMPESLKGPPPSASEPADASSSQEPVFLSWNFINGLFLGILVLEFVIFPILFWMWFGPGSQQIDEMEKETTDDEKK
ncbi:hypothetical protein SAMN02910356_01857 [Selenomonas sp. GACV-9]|uniref:hypothetical protein n=1 Tax=Selenomonas sp. GACV-9 TaxID=3158782 RepID=UPI0008E7FCE6|nr:hypothetical protein SAMN02910356_01857 [Selenomonas ruminantium]